MKLQCIILEDEPVAMSKMISYVDKTELLELKNTFRDATTALQWLETNSVQLAFVDIQMADISGMEWARLTKGKLLHIFATAYAEFAVESYKVNAVDYLLKPFSYSEFYEATEKAISTYQKTHELFQNKEYIFIKCGYQNRKFTLNDIKYIKASDDFVEVFYNSKPILANITLKELENQLPESKFIRVNRSFIVNISKIDFIERGVLIVEKERITLSEKYIEKFRMNIANSIV